jgi:hypothetical protein
MNPHKEFDMSKKRPCQILNPWKSIQDVKTERP